MPSSIAFVRRLKFVVLFSLSLYTPHSNQRHPWPPHPNRIRIPRAPLPNILRNPPSSKTWWSRFASSRTVGTIERIIRERIQSESAVTSQKGSWLFRTRVAINRST